MRPVLTRHRRAPRTRRTAWPRWTAWTRRHLEARRASWTRWPRCAARSRCPSRRTRRSEGRSGEGHPRAAPSRRRVHRQGREGVAARDAEPRARRLGLRREADSHRVGPGGRRREGQDRVPRLEPVPFQARGRHPERSRRHLHRPRQEGAVPRRRERDVGQPRRRCRRACACAGAASGLTSRRRALSTRSSSRTAPGAI